MLILFDIDATLISTSGAGIRAMHDFGREQYGPAFRIDGVEFAGRLDPLIISDMLRANQIEETPEKAAAFRAGYRRFLEKRLLDPTTVAKSLPGVPALLDALSAVETVTMALLTGNFQETGCLKLRHCGIDPDRFQLSVWGDESRSSPPRRDDLPGVALARHRERLGAPFEAGRAVVIGDTPHDVRCAQAHGCRSLGVATGSYTVEQLGACGPTRVVPDLSETRTIVDWLTSA